MSIGWGLRPTRPYVDVDGLGEGKKIVYVDVNGLVGGPTASYRLSNKSWGDLVPISDMAIWVSEIRKEKKVAAHNCIYPVCRKYKVLTFCR